MYVIAKEILDEGFDNENVSNSKIESTILLAQEYIERMTDQWFENRDKVIKLDGNNNSVIFLPVFASEISEVQIDGIVQSTDDYTVYNRFFPDDRYNPKIVFEFSLPKGKLNVQITGKFGFVDSDGDTPLLIKKITKKLVLGDLLPITDMDRRNVIDRGRIKEETTDNHSYVLADLASSGMFTGDPEIDDVLRSHAAPLYLGAV